MGTISVKNIDQRFQKTKIEEQNFLFINLIDSSEEEKISTIYRLTHHSKLINQNTNRVNLVIRYDQSFENERVLEHFVSYSTNSYLFKNVVFYGDISELLIAGTSRINRNLNTKIKCFKTKRDAIKYILKK
jgi:hypothetical protein